MNPGLEWTMQTTCRQTTKLDYGCEQSSAEVAADPRAAATARAIDAIDAHQMDSILMT